MPPAEQWSLAWPSNNDRQSSKMITWLLIIELNAYYTQTPNPRSHQGPPMRSVLLSITMLSFGYFGDHRLMATPETTAPQVAFRLQSSQ